MTKELYSIGEMAKLCGVTIKTLRHYDEKGLLKPSYIDPNTSYRYYEKKLVLPVLIIKEYKSLNFSLSQIKEANNGDFTKLLSSLNKKLLETNQKIKELNYIKQRLTEYIKNFNNENLNNINIVKQSDYDFEVQYIPKRLIGYTRYRCPHNPSMLLERYRQFNVIMEENKLYKIGPLMAIFHDDYLNYNYNSADIEVCYEIVGDNKNLSCVREFGGFWAIIGLHRGPYDTLLNIYKAALVWLEDNNLEYIGHSAIERYIVDAISTNDTNKYVTEVILPIKNTLDSPLGLDIIVE